MDVKGPSDTLLAALAQMRAAREAPPARPAPAPAAERPAASPAPDPRAAVERSASPAAASGPQAHAPGDIRRKTPLGSLVDLRV